MEKQKRARWLYIALLAVVVLIGIWMVIDLAMDGREPEATPTPQVQVTESPTPQTEETASPAPAEAPADTSDAREQAKDFSLVNLKGDTVALSDQQGNVTVVNFWGAWCGWCLYEMPEFAEMVTHYEEQDVAFLFVDYGDDEETAREAMEEYGISLEKVLMDTEGAVVQLYQVQGFPTTYILDKQGGVAETFVGASTKDDVMPIIDALLAE